MEVIKPKFELGQKVWMLINSKAVEKEVKRVSVTISADAQDVTYNMVGETEFSTDNYECYSENRVFATKDDLKKHVFGD